MTSLLSAMTCRSKMGMGSPGIQWRGLNAPWMPAPTRPNSEVPKPLSTAYWTPRIKANANHPQMQRNEKTSCQLPARPQTPRPYLDRRRSQNFERRAQRQLFDDIKANRCTRCHKDDHHRAKCTLPPAKWEEKFDREKVKYWESVLKYWESRESQSCRRAQDWHQHLVGES